MKRKISLLLLFVFVLATFTACGTNFSNLKDTQVNISTHTGNLGDFSLTSPSSGQTVYEVPTFTWKQSQNASYYIFELCSSLDFSNVDEMGNTIDVYVKKTGITDTEITPTATVRQKDQTYYWRVTAVNGSGSKLCTDKVGEFYLASPEVDEIEIPIDYADEWELHSVGSYADISVNKNNFFDNDKNSLVIAFDKEHTNSGNPESDGWLCVTHSVEKDFYGVDAFKFDFYYSGDDTSVMVRVVDADNEYWQSKVQIAGNSKQTVFIRFDEFTLRTSGDTTIANQEFDYNYIRTVDFTFERTFGDGVAVISNILAVKFDNYQNLFVKKFNFSNYTADDFIYNDAEGTTFAPTTANDGSTLNLSFSGNNGYAFARLPINAFFETGDAIKVTLNYVGNYKSQANIVLRLIEEDGDRWSYSYKASLCDENGTTLIIPFSAFVLSEANADGSRQFSYIKQLQFGFSGGVYGSGMLTFADMEVVTLADEMNNLYQKTVGTDGVIENFENYTSNVELYYTWQTSSVNKDEAMSLGNIGMFSFNNNAYGVFAYKSDMESASYSTNLGVEKGFESLQFSAMDNSTKDDSFTYLQNAPAKLTITLYNQTGQPYTYTIDALNSYWTTYNIPFSAFASTNPNALTSEDISAIKIDMQYFYYDQNGNAKPSYRPQNEVFIDDIMFAYDKTLSANPSSMRIVANNTDITTIEQFDSYKSVPADVWSNGALTTSYDKSNALSLDFVDKTVETTMLLQVDKSVQANALSLAFDGDGQTTVIVQITFVYAGKEHTVATTLYNVGNWTKYIIGWDYFKTTTVGGLTLNKNIVQYITAINISATTNNSTTTHLLIDDICFDAGVSGSTKTQIEL